MSKAKIATLMLLVTSVVFNIVTIVVAGNKIEYLKNKLNQKRR